ncbi:Imm8 family immunity protein [Priestia megaterium]|uniref:Imm8 family immunity protein n=1 Tax=Priestia megaterium TaxID=1404 RepID=UPI00203BB411|nr:Imm8 family immunity protein [Priestia megaterium]MCM3795343.1 immunity 8 family protein [Priestia megaterium]
MIVKALTIIHEDWGETFEDFCIYYQLDVGLKGVEGASDMFSFEVISPTRLYSTIEDIEIGRGYLIMKDYDQNKVEQRVKRLVEMNREEDFEDALKNLSTYFRWDMDK